MKKKILINAGETSGDRHAAQLVEALLRANPDLEIFGSGGHYLKKTGIPIVENVTSICSVGFIEPIKHIPRYIKAMRTLKDTIIKEKIDCVIAVDMQGFNVRLLKEAKKLGCKTIYYILPQEWQWGTKKGGKKVVDITDHLVAIFPPEAEFYKALDGDVIFEGHPLIDFVKSTLTKSVFYHKHLINPDSKILAVFPGSRQQEMKYVLPNILNAAVQTLEKLDGYRIVISVAAPHVKAAVENEVGKYPDNDIIIDEGNSYDLIQHSSLSIVSSGTVTLEHAIMHKPCLVAYKLSPLSYKIAMLLVGKRWKENMDSLISLPNLILKKKIIPEFIQADCTPDKIAEKAIELLQDKQLYRDMKEKLQRIDVLLGDGKVLDKIAEKLVKRICEEDQ